MTLLTKMERSQLFLGLVGKDFFREEQHGKGNRGSGVRAGGTWGSAPRFSAFSKEK